MDGTLDEIEFLVASGHRVAVLETLQEQPRTRRELRGITGASSPTLSRILADFENRHWVERDGEKYALTELGAFVTHRLDEFIASMQTECGLREIWPWLPHDLDGFGVDLFTDVHVTVPSPGYPDKPTERRLALIAGASTWRGFGMAMLGLRTLEASFERFRDGSDPLTCEYIYPKDVFEELLSWNAETILDVASGEQYTVHIHDTLPIDDRFEICMFDDLVTICCYDSETGALRAVVETTSQNMLAWAEGYFERLRAEATPLRDVYGDLSS